MGEARRKRLAKDTVGDDTVTGRDDLHCKLVNKIIDYLNAEMIEFKDIELVSSAAVAASAAFAAFNVSLCYEKYINEDEFKHVANQFEGRMREAQRKHIERHGG